MIVLAFIVVLVVGVPLMAAAWQCVLGILELLLIVVPPLLVGVWAVMRALVLGAAAVALYLWRLTEHDPIPGRVPEASWEPLPPARLREGLHPGWRRAGPYVHPGWARGYRRLRDTLRR